MVLLPVWPGGGEVSVQSGSVSGASLSGGLCPGGVSVRETPPIR